ncbi:unnamed protein product [Adineta ricciae]|uniref:G-protein coupled receptors family 1 profile domain-containing protein n=1 Tax=Adineta ricciae TaxID=249248 RepID=A0A814XKF9_ADIRI|nr:unnamed protein product [Adineta ricciae]CAF1271246.1 unnamed protein product [Adineta ricciae]
MSLLISCYFTIIITYRITQIKVRSRRAKIEVPVILSLNTLCILVVESALQILDVNWPTIQRDFYEFIREENSFFCQFRSYLYYSAVSALYWSCALQAFFRFVRIVHPECVRMHQAKIYYNIFIPGQILFAFGSVLPYLLIFKGIQLIPNENYCTALISEFNSLLYLIFILFALPLLVMFLCYICIIFKIRRTSTSKLYYRKRSRREYFIIQRIMTVMLILSVASLPSIVDLIIYAPHGRLDSRIYRIEWISASLNALFLGLCQPFVNPQLRKLLKSRKTVRSKI